MAQKQSSSQSSTANLCAMWNVAQKEKINIAYKQTTSPNLKNSNKEFFPPQKYTLICFDFKEKY